MAIGTPFHPRTSTLCDSYDWRQWSGYLSPSSYNDFVQPEYAAIRNAAALIDVSPLYKYRVEGPDAEALMDRVVTQDVAGQGVGRVVYTPWCDGRGHVRQEGTLFRFAADAFQLCAAEPAFAWLRDNAHGMDVRLRDRSAEIAALSLQGPHSRAILQELVGDDVGELSFFGITEGRIGTVRVTVSRTGYTGDLGYEIWIPADRALDVWDALMETGARWQITPAGMLAMDISRIEAGFILINVDYTSAEIARIPDDRVTPYELGLGWAVKLDGADFVGKRALIEEKERGPRRRLVGLEIDWEPLERIYMERDLMPDLPMTACRESVPVYGEEGLQAGRASSRVWSKLLKKYIALATLDAEHAAKGSRVEMEVTVHYSRRRVPATVVRPPFFRPDRMRA
ncbi:MAG: aminomethyltransferase family protein [Acidobacteriota bacterium]